MGSLAWVRRACPRPIEPLGLSGQDSVQYPRGQELTLYTHRLRRTCLAVILLLQGAVCAACGVDQLDTRGPLTSPGVPRVIATKSPAGTAPVIGPAPSATATPSPFPAPSPSGANSGTPIYGYHIVNTYPHDPSAFTQGLVFEDGVLYEGTGLRGRSTLRRVALETGIVLQRGRLADRFFGEGITIYGDWIVQLTWQSNTGFVYDKDSFERLREFHYPTEGWGLTHDGEHLIMSDGTATLHFLDPESLQEIARIEVVDDKGPVTRLNELEYIRGEIYANVWQTERIARIDPQTGRVVGWIDLTGLVRALDTTQRIDVLNGIAYDAQGDRLFVTGKLWPKLFEVELVPPG